ncbi:DNA ligase D [Massilia sp. Dwa41.01b]|uniref:DNA ligase D n=1 Tax=Massilia sp. Dwa41.01b TaxID=2709302 RepID=UPI001602A741|nr:DNA ligase D [Massilia sp. Dwa41.01b]QNA88807.1 DNA ligase D [Massilia sp. Dwa41.01b]
MTDALKLYKEKRDFTITSEPAEGGEPGREALTFVIQKHWASRLHYDFRLELDGTMKSWAVPKGPSYDTQDKRMAVHVEDHPISYADFEGTIPEKQYGAGKVIIWDKGTWTPEGDPHEGYRKGNLKFELKGHKMHGRWVLVRMKGHGDEKQEPWLLIKEKDDYARPAEEYSVVEEMPDSVKSLPMPGSSEKVPAKARASKAGRATKAKADAAAEEAVAEGVADETGGKGTKAARKSASKPAAKAAARRGAKPASAAALPAGVVEVTLPEEFAPELATLVDSPPANPEEWVFEVKFDGYRMLTRIENGAVRLITRNNNDWTDKLRPLQEEIARMGMPDGWYDGEIVVHDANGRPNFGMLQLAFDGSHGADIMYFLFDAPYLGGYDLRNAALVDRRALLEAALKGAKRSEKVRFSDEFGTDPEGLVVAACKIGLEGVIGKRRDSRYVSRRSPEWIKLKCGLRQEFVICGYTDPKGSRTGVGSLLLGTYDQEGVLRYAGNVGSGFNAESLREVTAKLKALDTDVSPFPPRSVPGRKHHWVKPELVAEVSFSEWTNTGSVRHPVFQGLRKDKPAKGITREVAKPVEEVEMQDNAQNAAAPAKKAGKKKAAPAEAAVAAPAGKGDETVAGLPATLKVTHGERVVDAKSGATKMDLVRFYAQVGALMMPHLKRRPVSLVRAPAGIAGDLVFQKHADIKKLPGMKQMDTALDPDHPPMLEVDNIAGILAAAQWNAIEFHTQNATSKAYETPDRFVFDLDPGESVEWAAMQEAAQLMRAFLEELGLPAFLKTSGGKGLHVVVPVKGGLDWDTVKGFSQAVVKHLSSTLPDRFAFKSGAKNRVGKIFIDYLRNGQGATTVCAWSVRARPGLGVSVPLAWDELADLRSSDQWNVMNIGERIEVGNAPWDGYDKAARTLTAAMKKLGYKP